MTYSPQKSNPPEKNRLNTIINSIFRLSIVGIGLGTIFGSILANIDLTQPLFPDLNLPFLNTSGEQDESSITTSESAEVETDNLETISSTTTENIASNSFTFTQELMPLRKKMTVLFEKYANLQPSLFFVDLDNGAFVNMNGMEAFPAASTIKTPILVAFFQDVDEGKILLDEKLTMTEETKATEAGTMQYQPIGTQYTALKVAEEMIIRSDNTATNMLIERLGGVEALNQRFKEWGLESTVINNYLPDLEGMNTISARDLAMTLVKVSNGDLVETRSRDRLLGIMQRTITRTLLPQGIEPDAMIYHKTGDIGKVLGDGGIIDIPTGKRYVGAVLVQRPHNDYTARTMIQEISREAYQHFKWYQPRPTVEGN
ncbi:serine hydrolase [Cyanobacterium sp. HL-69]|uniref:serine hydrolase n=1 Tax=Cyanobacterium sp. HL-69 TaxID=2054282 RepID=UPI00406BC71B